MPPTEYQQEIESGERVIVGVNRFQSEEGKRPPRLRIEPAVEEQQVAGLTRVKSERDQVRVAESLSVLREAATGETNLMEPILAAVRTYASLGEICGVLREVFGEYRD